MQLLTLILVSVLLLTGLLGGGLSIREFRLYKATTGVKLTALLVSVILGASGSVLQRPQKVTFSLTSSLKEGFIRERIILTIEGEELGFIASSVGNPEARKEFTVLQSGAYLYSIELLGYEEDGEELPFYFSGSGTIDIEQGDVFDVKILESQSGSNDGQSLLVLVEDE